MRSTFAPPTRHEFDFLFLEHHPRVGGGLDDISIFIPPPTQRSRRGGGLFSTLGGLAKKALPFLWRSVAPEAARLGRDVLGDVLEGKKFRESLKTRGVSALKNVGSRLVRGGRVRKRITKGKSKTKKRKPKYRVAKSCYKSDIFDVKGLV